MLIQIYAKTKFKKGTERYTDLGKVNLPMVVRF